MKNKLWLWKSSSLDDLTNCALINFRFYISQKLYFISSVLKTVLKDTMVIFNFWSSSIQVPGHLKKADFRQKIYVTMVVKNDNLRVLGRITVNLNKISCILKRNIVNSTPYPWNNRDILNEKGRIWSNDYGILNSKSRRVGGSTKVLASSPNQDWARLNELTIPSYMISTVILLTIWY